MPSSALSVWHDLVRSRDSRGLDALLAEDVVFHSPVVHTPQYGKAITRAYLGAALQVFINDSFHYVREVVGPNDAVLEFEVDIDGIRVNGVLSTDNTRDVADQIRRLPGVFAAGEMLDWEAPTGGYLLTACWATGRAAGLGAADWLATTSRR